MYPPSLVCSVECAPLPDSVVSISASVVGSTGASVGSFVCVVVTSGPGGNVLCIRDC